MSVSVPKNKSRGCLKGCLLTFLVLVGVCINLCIVAVIFVPDSSRNTYENASRSYEKKEYKKALRLIDKSIKIDSGYPEYHLLKGMVLFELLDTITSEKEIAFAKALSDSDSLQQIVFKKIITWRIQKNDTAKAEKLVRHFLKPIDGIDFRSYANSYYYTANTMVILGKPEQASTILISFIDSIQKFKTDTINFRNTHHQISKEFLNLGDTIQSISVLKRLIKEYPNSPLAYKKIGNYYFIKKINTKAIQYFKKHISLDTSDVSIYRKIGQSYSSLKKKKSALKYLRIAAEKGDQQACTDLRELTAKTKYYTQSQCCDGTTSRSTGRGTCSHHGGVCGVAYIPYKVYTISCN